MKVGYVKDAMASLMFLAAFIVLYTNPRRVPVQYILTLLLLGLTVDTLFTLNPRWHCEEWSESRVAKYVLFVQLVVFSAVLLRNI